MKVILNTLLTMAGFALLLQSASATERTHPSQTLQLLQSTPDSIDSSELLSQRFIGQPEVIKADRYRVLADKLNANTKRLNLNLADGRQLDVVQTLAYITNTGSLIWQGKVINGQQTQSPSDNTIVVVKTATAIAATIRFDNRLLKLTPDHRGVKSNHYWLSEIDQTKLPQEHDPKSQHNQVDDIFDASTSPIYANREIDNGKTEVIRVLIGYTREAKQQNPAIDALVELAIAETNQGYLNSGVNGQVELAHLYQLEYSDSGDHSVDLDRFHQQSDGYMDEVHDLRDQYGADVAGILIGDASYCGRARAIGATADSAFFVVKDSCATGYYSFGHELGHLLSARHNPEQDSKVTPFEFGHGFLYSNGGWRSIMAYNSNSCCARQNFWSDPTRVFDGVQRGSEQTHDNARVLNLTTAVIADFRPDTGGNTPPIANFSTSINGLVVNFNDNSTDVDGNIIAYQWTFGDGSTAIEPSPTYQYTSAGDYLVGLTVTDGAGASNHLTKTVTVSAIGQPVILSKIDFESGFDSGWANSNEASDLWLINSGKTPSSSTGPMSGASRTPSNYAYLETSKNYAYDSGDTAYLVSPVIGGSDRRLAFSYHMYGSDIGSVNVDVFHQGVWQNNVLTRTGQIQTSTSAVYKRAELDLSDFSGEIMIRFRAVADGGYKGDIAIDDIEITGTD